MRPGACRTTGDIGYQTTIEIHDQVVAAIRNQNPLLIETVVVGPLDDIRPGIYRSTGDVKYQAAIAVFNLKKGAVRNEGPLLIGAAVVGPLDHLRARVCPSAGDVHYQATFAVFNLIVFGGSIGGEGTATNRVAPLLLHNIRILVQEHVRTLGIARPKRKRA